LDKLFEYGFSDTEAFNSSERRGQGLFVARNYMAKMGGGIRFENQHDGVIFCVDLAGSRYFCESFYRPPCPTSGKNYATANACGCRQLMLVVP
jgi:hypothetical protein